MCQFFLALISVLVRNKKGGLKSVEVEALYVHLGGYRVG